MSTIEPATAGQNGAVAFATTHWSIVLTAQSELPGARDALEKLCCTYWRPLYTFVRHQGYKHEEAEDLTQGFFAVLLERKGLDTLRKERGRLRSFLLVSLKHFLADQHRRALRIKRGKGQPLIPLEELRHAEVDVEPSDASTAERIYERRWASTLLDRVFAQLKVAWSLPPEDLISASLLWRALNCMLLRGRAYTSTNSHADAKHYA